MQSNTFRSTTAPACNGAPCKPISLPGANFPAELIVQIFDYSQIHQITARGVCKALFAYFKYPKLHEHILGEATLCANKYVRKKLTRSQNTPRPQHYVQQLEFGVVSTQCVSDFAAVYASRRKIMCLCHKNMVSYKIVECLLCSGRPDAVRILRKIMRKYGRILFRARQAYATTLQRAIEYQNAKFATILVVYGPFLPKFVYSDVAKTQKEVVMITRQLLETTISADNDDMMRWYAMNNIDIPDTVINTISMDKSPKIAKYLTFIGYKL